MPTQFNSNNQGNDSTENGDMNYSSKQQQIDQTETRRKKESEMFAMLGNVLLYVGESIILFTNDDRLQVLTAYIKLTAGGLLIVAANLQANKTAAGMELPLGAFL